jgi:hypothetical protein
MTGLGAGKLSGWEAVWQKDGLSDKINSHRDLEVYKLAFSCAMEIFQISKSFPAEERYSLTDQIRRASSSVSTVHIFPPSHLLDP